MTALEKTQIETNIAKLLAETTKLNTETESLRFRDQIEFIKVFFYGAITTAAIIGAIAQLMERT